MSETRTILQAAFCAALHGLAVFVCYGERTPEPPASLEIRESTSHPDYETILRAIDASRESRKARESQELRELIDKAIRERLAREAWEQRS